MSKDRAPELHVDYFGQGHNATHDDVLLWQEEMAWRGWKLDPDQKFGAKSEEACRGFQQAKGLGVDGLVGPDTWSATWNLPVTQPEIFAMHAL